ncbi:MAG TPA: hypothetical protein DIT58_12160 [Porticoccaceae bacterium]|nr:hypothetical protein [Porticoccaceae bacterium]
MNEHEDKREEKRLATVAMHEAGHVVVSHYYGRRVYGAKLGEEGSRMDRSVVRFELTPHVRTIHNRVHELAELWPLAVRETLVTTRIRFAGPVSQAVYLKKPFREVHGGQDYYDALVELLRLEKLRISLPGADQLDITYKDDNILDMVAEDVVDLFVEREYINYVGRVARGLIEKQELSESEINNLLHDMPLHIWD